MQRITDTSYTPTESGYVGGATLENIEIFRPPEQIKHLLAGLHIENILRRNSGSTSARSLSTTDDHTGRYQSVSSIGRGIWDIEICRERAISQFSTGVLLR
jgi:hypothetical protein